MNPYIKGLSEDLIAQYIEYDLSDVKIIRIVKEYLHKINSETDKLELITSILEANELKYQNHLKGCTDENCFTHKEHIEINYFLQQELEALGVEGTDSFTREEKEKYNKKLDEILRAIINSNEIINESIEILKQEIEELKSLYVLGKKNWKQQFAGKFLDMVYSGVVSEITAKPIIEKILKPSGNFIANLLVNTKI